MEEHFHYGTISEAINKFRQQGFLIDFNLESNCIVCDNTKFRSEEFEIVDMYRYEGNSDPADEATVYAIESKTGLKGLLVTGYGISTDSTTSEMLRKLHYRKKTSNVS